jgi:penicillin-binding protein 2
VDDGKGWKAVRAPAPHSTVPLDPEKLQAVRDGLWIVVNAGGTGGKARIAGHDVSGKTGTAQVISNQGKAAAGKTNKDLRDHGWFVFFAPRDNPQIAGVVFAEHAEHGSNAAPIAKHAMETFFAKQDGTPLPPPLPVQGNKPQPPPAQGDDPLPLSPAPVAQKPAAQNTVTN